MNPGDPGYDHWLIGKRIRDLATHQLLHAMVSRDVRTELHHRWRAERCNGATAYTDVLDCEFTDRVALALEERIDRASEVRK